MKRSGFTVMARLVGLVRPLAGYMALAVTMGLAGHLCATFLTVAGGFGILKVLGLGMPLPLAWLFGAAALMALLRAVLRYGEQACNHNNLRIARQDATDAQIEAACRKASIHDWITALPQGYDTPGGELGDTLSGGERQRLGLARAFLHDAPFLLLDEPTSNLDSLNEAVILRALEQEHGQRTVVLVSHRASTMCIADTVYSVENGRVS